jgi:hypothetical protein
MDNVSMKLYMIKWNFALSVVIKVEFKAIINCGKMTLKNTAMGRIKRRYENATLNPDD